jgi:hypothetical protein
MRTNIPRWFEGLDELDPTPLRREIERRASEPTSREIPGVRGLGRRVAAGVVAVAVFAAAAGFAWTIFDRTARQEPVAPSDPWSWAPEGWTELPLPPEVRDEAAIVWTGQELVYWGGWPRGAAVDQAKPDGFALDPETRTWRLLPPAPVEGGGFEALSNRRAGAKAVWTGSEVVFWDVETGDGASSATLALDPTTGVWRRLDDSPHRPTCCGTWAWTGRELIVFGGGYRQSSTTVEGAALDPAMGRWRRIADAPMAITLGNALWTGNEVIVVGSQLDNRNVAETPTAITLGYDPATDGWRRLPDAPLSPQSSEAVWFEDRVLAWDYGNDSAQYLPAEDRWQGLGRLPLDHGECYVGGVAIEAAVFAWNCGLPDAWYPGFGWANVDGGPPARQVEIDETYLGSHGRAIAAGSVAVVEQVDNMWVNDNLHIGSSDAPIHLWVWRPLVSPVPPPPPTADDAEYLVSNFLIAWGGYETYLPTLATQDVIDRCREGVDGCANFGEGGLGNWRFESVTETAPGIFEVAISLRVDDGVDVPQTFVVGPGMTADGFDGRLIVIDAGSSGRG